MVGPPAKRKTLLAHHLPFQQAHISRYCFYNQTWAHIITNTFIWMTLHPNGMDVYYVYHVNQKNGKKHYWEYYFIGDY